MNLHPSISTLASKLGMSRQNFYKGRIARQRAEVDADLIERLVRRERALQPRLGGRKLFKMLTPALEEAGIKIGRDKFFAILRERGLLVPPLPKSGYRTTKFSPSLPVFHNLTAGIELTGPNQAWAADITYIRTLEGFLFLFLITDMFSRKIVGFHVGENLTAEGAMMALAMALSSLKKGEKPIHHSDRGCQYASHLYVDKLIAESMQISMTEELHCYENALAERVNGILKQEYYLGSCIRTLDLARTAVKEAVTLYNTRRPHMSLNYQTPDKVHGTAA